MKMKLTIFILLYLFGKHVSASDSIKYKIQMRVTKQLKPLPRPIEFGENITPASIAVSYNKKLKSLIGIDSFGNSFSFHLFFEKAGKGWMMLPAKTKETYTGKYGDPAVLPIMIRLKDSLLLGVATNERKDGVFEDRILKQNNTGMFGNEKWAEAISGAINYRRNLVQDPWSGRIFYVGVNRPPSDSNKFAATILELNTQWKSRKFANNLLQKNIQVSDLALSTTPDGRIVLFAFTSQGLRMYVTDKNYLQNTNEFLGCPGNCFTGERPVFKEVELPDFLKKVDNPVPASLSLTRIVGRINFGVMLSVGVRHRKSIKYISVPMFSIIDADAQEAWVPGNTVLTFGRKKKNPECFSVTGPEASDYGRNPFAFRGVYQTYILGKEVHYRIIHENGSIKAGILNNPDSAENSPSNLHTVSLRVGDSIAFLSIWNEGNVLCGNLLASTADTTYEKIKIVKKAKPENYDAFREDDHTDESFVDISGGYFSPKFSLDFPISSSLVFNSSVAVPVSFLYGKLWQNKYSLSVGYGVYTFYQKITITKSGVAEKQDLSFVRVTNFPITAGYRFALPALRWHINGAAGFQFMALNGPVRHSQRQATTGINPVGYRTGYSKSLKIQPIIHASVEYSMYKKIAVIIQCGYQLSGNGYLKTVIYNQANTPDFFYHTRLQGLNFAAGLRLYPQR